MLETILQSNSAVRSVLNVIVYILNQHAKPVQQQMPLLFSSFMLLYQIGLVNPRDVKQQSFRDEHASTNNTLAQLYVM